ncbi:MAG: hypothetical protein ACD_38C00075G0003 [uncultured bacterium]|uniref:Uncharacterized protein n=1 Tax=Candidatus Daviesbacteria bacterium GW2011_GWC2_40_12 TaxID=1618431 RepID=A0A0G0TX43_9BACT|nr:MAG: hypothetical protein ACD_38C00075G0003 [uncultured bacterium]KKQ83226.1 MAG: hypothetical protein UT04_C0035G0002 [Candidatus Daviesbacteria bacterium GW2011_GWF2_38_7]KKR15860.1 MAG: hypothetical protein UT45_C0012G0020 [Candidatus Daviesbacteria bacterium GW2011_GWA2_39_33]KKR22397.1 MAG: hypothetical protein UT54_C0069G0002 [Candidatus Daviesbacteria bacterium GW2011_GWB1_39_5]KKR42552.1 MAG: hypothetical protein UT77_C0001G0003 [Candidatus Daviesbacteria bacterium GW2011_GWC2_40_12]
MFGFSRKRFLVTLGLSVLIWIVSNFIQLLNSNHWPAGFSLLGGSCTVTGYPFAFCLAGYEKVKILLIYLVNIAFWFWVLHFLWKWFNKGKSSFEK